MSNPGCTVPIRPATFLIVAAAIFFAFGAQEARAETPSSTLSATDATGTPYSDKQEMGRALDWRSFGIKQKRKTIRLCSAMRRPVPWIRWPTKSRYETWRAYGDAHMEYGLYYYRLNRKLYYQITHPSGSPSRMPWQWAPLLRYCGVPERHIWRSIRCMGRESRGRRLATNHPWYGLYQFSTVHWRGRWNWRDPYQQCSRFARAVRNGTVRYHWRATW
jgi:hypothetical protein